MFIFLYLLLIVDLQQASVGEQVVQKTVISGESSREKDLMLSVQQLLEKYESGWQPVVVHQGGGKRSFTHYVVVLISG